MVSNDIGQPESAPVEHASPARSEPIRRASRWPAWATILILIALAALWLGYRFYLLAHYEAACISNGHALQIEISRQLADLGERTRGRAASSGQAGGGAVDLAAISLTNPFTGQPAGLVTPGNSYHPGDLLLIPAAAHVTLSEVSPARTTTSPAFQAYYVLPIGLRARRLMQFRGYADLDRDGVADPLLGCFGGMSTCGRDFFQTIEFEPVETALLRQGIGAEQGPRPSLRADRLNVLRFLLGLGAY